MQYNKVVLQQLATRLFWQWSEKNLGSNPWNLEYNAQTLAIGNSIFWKGKCKESWA